MRFVAIVEITASPSAPPTVRVTFANPYVSVTSTSRRDDRQLVHQRPTDCAPHGNQEHLVKDFALLLRREALGFRRLQFVKPEIGFVVEDAVGLHLTGNIRHHRGFFVGDALFDLGIGHGGLLVGVLFELRTGESGPGAI